MSELALRTSEFLNKKDKYTSWRPVGSVITLRSDWEVRFKWLEIVCSLVRPSKRESFSHLPGFKLLCDHWTQELLDEFYELSRPTPEYPHGGVMFNVPNACQNMWTQHVDINLIKLLGKETLGVRDLTDTFLWGDSFKKRRFIVVNTDATNPEIRAMEGFHERFVNGAIVISPKVVINYKTQIGLSMDTLTKIANPDTVVHPRFDLPVSKLSISTPTISLEAIDGR